MSKIEESITFIEIGGSSIMISVTSAGYVIVDGFFRYVDEFPFDELNEAIREAIDRVREKDND